MFFLVILALAAVYTAFGVVIIRRSHKPTCRICLFRQFCPNRKREYLKFTGEPCWSREQTTEQTEPVRSV